MDDQKKTPNLRFKGFSDAWQQRKLGEVVNRYDNLRVPITKSERISGETPYYGANGIQDYIEGYTHEGEFILIAEDGANDIKNYPIRCVEGKIWVNNHAHVLQSKIHKANNIFLMNNLKSVNIEPFLVGGGRAKLNADVLMRLSVIMPHVSEQTKIGEFFNELDNTIAKNERKLALLKQLKKAYLQQLFPNKEEVVPRLRFAHFDDPWEERKLGDISVKVSLKNTNKKYLETFTNSAELGIVSQRNYFDKEITNQNNIDSYYVVKKNDFVYNPRISNHAPVGPIKKNNLGRTGVMSPLYYVFSATDINDTYLEKYYETTNWHRFMQINGDSGARSDRFSIRNSVFINMPIPYPSISEQIKIGDFIDQISENIISMQKKIRKLKKLKKAYLQQMFI